MSVLLMVLLCIDAALLGAVVCYVVLRLCKNPVEEVYSVPAAPVVVEPKASPVVEDKKIETAVSEVVEKEAVVEDEKTLEVADDSVVEDSEDDREAQKRIPFYEKMLFIDRKTQEYYNAIHNKFRSMRKINPRISTKGVSYRLGRELVAKITVRGKTMRLHLALDVANFEERIYFQKNLSDVKAYAEVPLMVKVKSDRGLKNALKLVDALVSGNGIEYKTRYTETESIEDLKAIANEKR